MKSYYPLKKSQPTNLVQPLAKYLELNVSHDKANQFRPLLSKINELRNKATSLDLSSNPNPDTIKKYIAVIEMYVKFAILIAKHFNWNPEFGNTVQDLGIVWSDSFNPSVTCVKNQIHYDIFCCFYNLGILYFHTALNTCLEELPSVRKQSMTAAKNAYYYFNRNRTYYYKGFMNTGFSDTDYGHLQMLQYTCLGIVYKNFFNNFKEDQYKIGINKIAALAGLAKQHFYNAYQVGTVYFMKASYISSSIKTELLSFIYVQSLYHDVISNTKYAKHYENEMDFDKSNIIYLIAYQRRALRLLNLGISNESVNHLLDQRPQQKKELLKIKPQLQSSISKNANRNEQIYKKQEIPEEKLPPPPEPPKQYLLKPKQPEGIAISYEGTMTAPFAKLIDNESKGFMTQLRQYANNRIVGLQSAFSKLQKNIEQRFNDGYVNYYLNLDQQQQKGVPQNIKKKIQQIRANGGGSKLEIQAKIIKSNSQQVAGRFQQLRNMIAQQAAFDDQKRNQYGNSWRRPPSIAVNKSYMTQIQNYQNKAKQADAVNYKLLEKYHALEKYIQVIDKDDNAIMSVLPKIQVNQFISQNKNQFGQLKSGFNDVKQKQVALQMLMQDIIKFYNKMDFEKEANTFYKELNEGNRQEILAKIFSTGKQHIESFNNQARALDDLSQNVAQISRKLNSKNKSDDYSKKQFEAIMGHFNAIANLFQQLSQGTNFYTKLNDILVKVGNDLEGFIEARKMEAIDLEKSLKKGGNHGTPNLPSMYPNQQPAQMIQNNNVGFYVPPPTFGGGNNYMGGPTGFQQFSNNNVNDMLNDMMKSRPDFNTDVFGGNVYVSKVKRF